MSNSDNADLCKLTEQTLSALEIQRQPFDSQAGHFRYFVDDKVTELLSELQEALEPEDVLPVVIAPRGAGKTALLELLVEQTHGGVQYFLVEGNEQFNANNVFAGMLEAFQEPAPDDLQACLDSLAVRLQQLDEQNLRAVILLDDAEQVPPTELYKLVSGMLYMRDGAALPSFRIALTAAPSFEDAAARAIPEDTDLHELLLPMSQLDLNGTEAFIAHHLQGAGYFESLPLDGTAIAEVRHAANGLPGLTLIEAARRINERYGESDAPATRIRVEHESWTSRLAALLGDKRVLAGIALAFLAIGSSVFFGRDDNAEPNFSQEPMGTRIISEPLRLPRDEAEDTRASAEAPTTLPAPAPNAPPRLVLLSEKDDLKPLPEKATPKAPEPPAPPVSEPTREPAAVVPKPVVTVRPTPPVENKPAVKPQPEPEPTQAAAPAAETPADTAADSQESGAPLESANWVLMQDADQFTVQMIASSSRAEVERFLTVHELDAPNSIFSFARGDETWYALIHGLYPSIEAAQAAIRDFPEAVRTRHPWIRQVGRIHESLKNRS